MNFREQGILISRNLLGELIGHFHWMNVRLLNTTRRRNKDERTEIPPMLQSAETLRVFLSMSDMSALRLAEFDRKEINKPILCRYYGG